MTLRVTCWVVLVAGLVSWAGTNRAEPAFPYHTFDADGQGWRYAGSSLGREGPSLIGDLVPWDTRGNPGGALAAVNVFDNTWVAAPSAFLGDQSDMYGRSFQYDIFIRYTDGVPWSATCIQGNGLSLIYADASAPPLDQWQTRTVTFDESLWRVDTDLGRVATHEELVGVLSSLSGLYLLTEWRTGPDDTSVDNVGVVPEPSTFVLLAAAGAGALAWTWRRRMRTA